MELTKQNYKDLIPEEDYINFLECLDIVEDLNKEFIYAGFNDKTIFIEYLEPLLKEDEKIEKNKRYRINYVQYEDYDTCDCHTIKEISASLQELYKFTVRQGNKDDGVHGDLGEMMKKLKEIMNSFNSYYGIDVYYHNTPIKDVFCVDGRIILI